MEGILKMKITDYAILFMTIISSFVVVYFLKDSILFQTIVYNEEFNRIVDNTTVNALDKGYTGINNTQGKINADIVVESFIKDMCYMMYGIDSKCNRNKITENIVSFIIINEDGYYVYEDGVLSEKLFFQNILHEKRVAEIENIIKERIYRYNYKIVFPKNNGEHNSQTIKLNSILVIYRTNISSFFGNTYAECIISGAAIKPIKT